MSAVLKMENRPKFSSEAGTSREDSKFNDLRVIDASCSDIAPMLLHYLQELGDKHRIWQIKNIKSQ